MSANDRLNNARELLEKFSRSDSSEKKTANLEANADAIEHATAAISLSNKQKKAKQRLRNKVVYYLSLREYSYQELKDKLHASVLKENIAKEQAPEDDFSSDFGSDSNTDDISLSLHYQAADEVVDDFRTRGLLSDARFTEQVVHARKAKFGSSRIAHELRQKGVDDSLISAAIATVKTDEFANALDICRKKYKATPQTRSEWAKQARFLQSRGFSFDVIKKVLNHTTIGD